MSFGEAAERIASQDFVRIAVHADADGIASAAAICTALNSENVGYHVTALKEPSEVSGVDADVLCDLGAAYLDELDDHVVIDHHPPAGEFDGVLVGTDSPSSSVAAHRVASRLSSGSPIVALVGAVGDGVPLERVEDTVEEAVTSGVEKDEGVRLVGNDAVEALAYSTHPFTRLSGDYEGAREFVNETEDIQTGVVLLSLTNDGASPEAVADIVGEVYRLPVRTDVHLHELSRYVETCAVSGKHGLALSLCLSPEDHLDDARSAWREFESSVIERVRSAKIEDGEPSFALTNGSFDTGAVADVLYDWVTGDVVVVNEGGDASFRGSFDCGRVARESARSVGGEGGGHPSRAGASFETQRDEFIREVRRLL